ncbi:MAG TPA: Gfo/Idh/MocA family oxidoreductase [Candidatus Limnocylindrales bacterium]|nr:Gfo/Idh/MocA family oxidoreductase [Candidatus Limnocylindrales bacterium]
MTRSPIAVGLAGLGSMGRNHLRVLTELPAFRVAAIADPVADALAAAETPDDTARYRKPVEMICDAPIEAVVVAAPTTYHRELALAAIDRGIPVLVEKPLAATPDEAAEIIDAAAARHVPVQVGHIERFNPGLRALVGRLDAGSLSEVYSVSARRTGPFPARIRDVGVTIDLATHDLDVISWVAAERPERAYAEVARHIHTSHEDLVVALLHFPSGATGMLDVNWLTPVKRRQLVVVGREGMFELDYLTQRLTFTRLPADSPPDLIAGYAPTFEGETEEIPVEHAEPLRSELIAFGRTVRERIEPEVRAEDGLWALALATALLRSAELHEPVELAAIHPALAR